MFQKIIVFTLAVGLAGPAFANERLEELLGVEPGVYSLVELHQIMNASGRDRAVRIELINRQHAEFEAAVRRIQRGSLSTVAASSRDH